MWTACVQSWIDGRERTELLTSLNHHCDTSPLKSVLQSAIILNWSSWLGFVFVTSLSSSFVRSFVARVEFDFLMLDGGQVGCRPTTPFEIINAAVRRRLGTWRVFWRRRRSLISTDPRPSVSACRLFVQPMAFWRRHLSRPLARCEVTFPLHSYSTKAPLYTTNFDFLSKVSC